MIKKLHRKLVLIVMAVVTLILLAIFFTMLLTTQRNNERMSVAILHQALNVRPFPDAAAPPATNNSQTFRREGSAPQMRLPVLVIEMGKGGEISAVSNQFHFIGESDIAPIAELAAGKAESIGILPGYALRYLRENTENGVRIAFVDVSVEQEVLRAQIANSLLIGGLAMLAFFFLSLILARWAVHPVEVAWKQQKQFIANASHELKTPLTVILSNIDMLRADNNLITEKNTRRMEHIHAEAVRMKQLVESMFTLARSDSGQKTEMHSRVDFSFIVKSAVLMYEPIFYDEEKELSYEIEDNITVNGDVQRLQQVIHILLDNARKYSSAYGAIHVRLSKPEHKSLLLRVTNEGSPIPAEELERIFLRFYRCDQARSEHGSFGLGLSIAQSIVTEHKGNIWADSDEASGNSFYVSLPLA